MRGTLHVPHCTHSYIDLQHTSLNTHIKNVKSCEHNAITPYATLLRMHQPVFFFTARLLGSYGGRGPTQTKM